MVTESYTRIDPVLYPGGSTDGSVASAVSLSSIFVGAIAALALTLTLVIIGSAFGLASVSPWPGVGLRPTTFTIGAGIWLVVTQWLSAAIGGYFAGRLRIRWHGVHTDEVFFRDTAHGFTTWALATVVVAVVAVVASSLAQLGAPSVNTNAAKDTMEAARKVAPTFAAFTGVSLLVGAFIGSVCGAIGGRLRDMHP